MPLPTRVFIVDDSASWRHLTRETLEQSDCQVVGEARSGTQALTALDTLQCDVVIADHDMPGMSGLQFVQELCRRPDHPTIVALTGTPDERVRQALEEAGAAAVFDKDQLAAVVELVCGMES